MNEAQKHYTEWKNIHTEYAIWLHWNEVLEQNKLMYDGKKIEQGW